jgi:hypothetical protein
MVWRSRVRWLMVALLVGMTGCAGPSPMMCGATQQSTAVADLFFGRNIDERLGVSEAAWQRFLADEVTPRFPDGLTVVDGAGQWRDGARLVREPSKVVTIVLRDRTADQARIDAVVEAYKLRFRQQSVGVVIRPACVSF